jgi:acido-empty-quinoprotein group A
MKTHHKLLLVALFSCAVFAAAGAETLGADWPTYHGDYSGRRFSSLQQINRDNVKNLSLAWVHRLNLATQDAQSGGEGAAGPTSAPVEAKFGGGMGKATPLMVDGVLYFSVPDHVWAVDARSGRQKWHFFWRSTGGIHVGNRGVGISGNYLFFLTPDAFLVSLDRRTGKERWHKQIADVKQAYFASVAPLVVGNHVLVAPSGDAENLNAWVESRDPESGELQWKWYTTPRHGEPESKSWPNAAMAEHGGGMAWAPYTYDPELKLVYVPTGNPTPVQLGDARRGSNLWTESIVALHLDDGKLAWYFQCSPHDTHDWDANEVPVLFDADWQGRPRKLVAQASRNGLFFVLDRVTGEELTHAPFTTTANWYAGFDKRGQPIGKLDKEPQVGGALVSPSNGGATNWNPPTYSPETGLLYLNVSESYSLYYRTQQDAHVQGSEGFSETGLGGIADFLRAIDVHTGQVVWSHTYAGTEGIAPRPEHNGGLMSTAGGLVFGGGPSSQLVAYDALSGQVKWHSGLHAPLSNTPVTYLLDNSQYILIAADDSLYAFRLQ